MSSHFYLHCIQTFSSWAANGFSGYLPNESFWRRRFRCAGVFCSLFLRHIFLHNSRSNWTGGNNLSWRHKILRRQPPVRFHLKQWTPMVTGYLLLWPIKQRRTDLVKNPKQSGKLKIFQFVVVLRADFNLNTKCILPILSYLCMVTVTVKTLWNSYHAWTLLL